MTIILHQILDLLPNILETEYIYREGIIINQTLQNQNNKFKIRKALLYWMRYCNHLRKLRQIYQIHFLQEIFQQSTHNIGCLIQKKQEEEKQIIY
ncbi:hypothetical protein pb186bvf_002367 [Paramecium bursaria]